MGPKSAEVGGRAIYKRLLANGGTGSQQELAVCLRFGSLA
jgi:hypothetical protein